MTAREWLLENGYRDVATLIDKVLERWKRSGVQTRRNWWEILAGGGNGDSRTVDGLKFPVLATAQRHEGRRVTANALQRSTAEAPPAKGYNRRSPPVRRVDPPRGLYARDVVVRPNAKSGVAAGAANRRRKPMLGKPGLDRQDARSWLRASGYADVAASIDVVSDLWIKLGKKTRRNWWEVLAGDNRGRPRKVGGVVFPVLAAAQLRQGRPVTRNALTAPTAQSEVVRWKRASSQERLERSARPFLKWAGGKRQLLHEIMTRLPGEFGTFHEPFVGGGAVFFALRPRVAVLSDRNERLIRAYRGIKDNVEAVIEILKTFRNNKRFFLQMRRRKIDAANDAEVAAWLIFLNKTGFNGLYRVNSRNEFNVPYGANPNAKLCDERNLRACAEALAVADLRCESFDAVLGRAQPRDVVYFDPPYVPLSVTSDFTSYTSQGFTMEDQVRLRDVALELRGRGAFVILSNSSAPVVRELYEPDFNCIPVAAARLVNSNPKGRGRVTELLIH